MICEHLAPLLDHLQQGEMPEQFVYPPPASEQPRPRTRWYFDCILDLRRLRKRFDLPEFVADEATWGTHAGEEQGFHCRQDDVWLMGHHPLYRGVRKVPRVG